MNIAEILFSWINKLTSTHQDRTMSTVQSISCMQIAIGLCPDSTFAAKSVSACLAVQLYKIVNCNGHKSNVKPLLTGATWRLLDLVKVRVRRK